MFILRWYREWLELRREYNEPKICETCEALKITVEQLRTDNQRLLDRLLEKPTNEIPTIQEQATPIKVGRQHIPWNVRQQILEKNDRHQAKLMREAPKPIPSISSVPTSITNQELEDDVLNENDLKNAEKERENTKS